LLQAVCSIVILFFIFFMPESPRWLCNKDRHEEALHIFAHWHGEGNENDDFIQLEYAEVKAAIELDKESDKTGWTDFFKTPGNRKRITIITAIGFFSQWSGNGLISYYLKFVMDNVGMTDPQTQLGINGGMKTLALCENFVFAFFIDKLGRRPIYLISTIGTFVVFNIFTIISARYEIAPKESLGVRCHGILHHRDSAVWTSCQGFRVVELLRYCSFILQSVCERYRARCFGVEVLYLLLCLLGLRDWCGLFLHRRDQVRPLLSLRQIIF
jgi:hypothetical protein